MEALPVTGYSPTQKTVLLQMSLSTFAIQQIFDDEMSIVPDRLWGLNLSIAIEKLAHIVYTHAHTTVNVHVVIFTHAGLLLVNIGSDLRSSLFSQFLIRV